jgi:hypothetical protein
MPSERRGKYALLMAQSRAGALVLVGSAARTCQAPPGLCPGAAKKAIQVLNQGPPRPGPAAGRIPRRTEITHPADRLVIVIAGQAASRKSRCSKRSCRECPARVPRGKWNTGSMAFSIGPRPGRTRTPTQDRARALRRPPPHPPAARRPGRSPGQGSHARSRCPRCDTRASGVQASYQYAIPAVVYTSGRGLTKVQFTGKRGYRPRCATRSRCTRSQCPRVIASIPLRFARCAV